MGWSRGADLFELLAKPLQNVDEVNRKIVYEALFEWAKSEDWDTEDEAFGLDPVLDELLKEKGIRNWQDDYESDEEPYDGEDLDD